jgi:hypothetical protein
MSPQHPSFRIACLAAALVVPLIAEPTQVIFQNGRSIAATSLVQQGDKLVVKTAAEGFTVGQSLPVATVDHVFGQRPPEVNQAIALLLNSNPDKAISLLQPVVDGERITAKFPGNQWLDAARALLVAHALKGSSKDCLAIGKEISDATPAQGIDPFVMLGKALLLHPLNTRFEDREAALRDLTTDNLPATICAYASFFRGNVFKKEQKNAEALDSYLSVPCVHPSGGMMLNAAAELQAADLLAAQGRRDEALALVHSALRVATGTVLADEAQKRLESLK